MTNTRDNSLAHAFLMLAGLLLAVGASGCGASAAEMRRVNSAVYFCDQDDMFEQMVELLRERMGRVRASRVGKHVTSAYRWHTSQGAARPRNSSLASPGDLALAFQLRAQPNGKGWRMKSEVSVLSHVVGSPRGTALTRRDATWPAWADEKENVMRMDLHQRLAKVCGRIEYGPPR